MPLDAYTRVLQAQGLLRLVSHEVLAGLFDDVKIENPAFLPEVIAETVHRAWLFGGGPDGFEHLDDFHALWVTHGLPEPVADVLGAWCKGQGRKRSFEIADVWQADGDSTQGRELAVSLIKRWEDADGHVPFVFDDPLLCPAVVLPFHLTLGQPFERRPACALNALGEPETFDLDPGFQIAHQIAMAGRWQLRGHVTLNFTTLKGPCDIPLRGLSACLPVLAALCFRSHGRRMPPFEVAFSGELAANGHLQPGGPTEGWDRKREALRNMGMREVILPGDWPVNEEVSARLMNDMLPRTAVVPGYGGIDSLKREIDDIHFGMRYGSQTPEKARTRLRQMLDEDFSAPCNLRAKPLKRAALFALASAECHLGDPSEARRLCAECIEGIGNGDAFLKGVAFVRLAVIETDWTRYDKSSRWCVEALELSDELPKEELNQLDLQMQAEGTRGQALMFQALLSGHESLKDEALACLDRSLDNARLLDAGAEATERNTPHSLANRLLWHALHAPQNAGEAWRAAWTASESCPKTRGYVLRHAQLVRYRALLVQGHATQPDWWDESLCQLPDEKAELGWLYCTASKYRGAWHAAVGNEAAAKRDFEEAVKLAESRTPLLRFIGGTALLQACESLLTLDPDLARAYLERAISVFRVYCDWFVDPLAGSIWMRRAERFLKGETATDNPQIHYPY